jgi:glycogen synthase
MGTPVIGRATGGLCEQIADLDCDGDDATGLLYRETPPDDTAVINDWRVIQRSETPIDRFRAPLYGAMVASLAVTLARAAELYKYDKAAYGKMLANLFDRAQSFSWNRAMDVYQKVYEMATR